MATRSVPANDCPDCKPDGLGCVSCGWLDAHHERAVELDRMIVASLDLPDGAELGDNPPPAMRHGPREVGGWIVNGRRTVIGVGGTIENGRAIRQSDVTVSVLDGSVRVVSVDFGLFPEGGAPT